MSKKNISNLREKGVAFAIPFGSDGTCGDSAWHPLTIPATKEDTFNSLRDKLRGEMLEPTSDFSGMDLEELDDLAGFWLIDASAKKAIDIAGNHAGEIGCDSALYRHISTLKHMAEGLAIKTILAEVKV